MKKDFVKIWVLFTVAFCIFLLNNNIVEASVTYDFWNITNYTTGEEIGSGGTYNRTNNLTVSARWNNTIAYAQIGHNGTGSWQNYTIPSPYAGNWTNYTIDLSNSSEFNVKTIGIRIYVNDTTSATNNTSTDLYFNLGPGNPPSAPDIIFNYASNVGTYVANLNNSFAIVATVSDDVGLSNVIANITYPTFGSIIKNMTGNNAPGIQKWKYYFGSDLLLNETGLYNVTVTAIDIGGQNATSVESSFTVYDYYDIVYPISDIFMRGENVTFYASNLNYDKEINVDWIVNITKIDETNTENITIQLTDFNYTIKNDDPEGNYSISLNASKSGNSGGYIWNFNVRRNLSIIISTDTALSRGNALNISVYLYNAKNQLHLNFVNSNITCPDGMHTLTFNAGYASILCNAPDSYSTSFNITVNATDLYNNSGENYTTFTTTQAPPPTGGSPGGGGPAPLAPQKNCTDGTLYNKCSTTRPLYCSNGTLTSKCSACKCESGYSCQLNETCTLTIVKAEDFNFTIDLTKMEIEQGKDFGLKGYLTNTGNIVLNLSSFLNISNNCCNVSLPLNFVLNEKEEKEFTISIHVPLFTNTSDYWIKIGIGTKYFNKEKLIDVKIVKSSYYADLSELKTLLNDIEKEVQEYKKVGIDTRNVDNMIEKSKSILNNVNSSISKDQVNVLSGSITDLKNNINYVSTSLTLLRGQRFISQNSWLIILLIISSILTVYFVPEVLMPLQKIDVELKKLKDDEKTSVSSRVETEKQYFTRRIDENMFTKIMITKQDNILKLKGAITEKEKDRKIILSRASPVEMLKWFGRGIKNLPKNIKNLFVGAYRKIKVPRISLFKKQNQK